MKASQNATFNKVQISSATDKDQLTKKLNSILKKNRVLRK